MEQRGPLWNRLISRIRRTNQNHTRHRARRQLRRQNSADETTTHDETSMLHQVFKNGLPLERRLNGRIRSTASSSSVFSSDFFQGMTNLRSSITDSYVPKVLTGFTYENLLQGSPSVDNFSRNCWLENHLHRFGGINADNLSDASSNISDYLQNSVGSRASSLLDLFGGFSLHAGRQQDTNSINSDLNVSIDGQSQDNNSVGSVVSDSAVSDITQYYRNMNLANATLDQQGDIVIEPPPYTEDPPPPYSEDGFFTRSQQNISYDSGNIMQSCESSDNANDQRSEICVTRTVRGNSSSSRASSVQLTNQAILW